MTAPRKDIWVFNAQATSTLLITVWYVVGVFLALAAVNGGAASGGAAAAATSDATAASPLFTSVSAFYQWGETLVIPLLLGVFYLGAGYLFQRHEHVDSFASWRTFMKRKTIVLLTPFFAFTILTLATASVVGTKPELMQAGIALQFFGLQERIAKRSNASAAVAGFVVVGALLFILNWTGAASLDILTALELLCFYSVSGACFLRGSQVRFYGFMTQYTMAIWLIHQILAKLCFCALFALGISWVGPAAGAPLAGAWAPIYTLTCLFACYVLPILVMKMLSRA